MKTLICMQIVAIALVLLVGCASFERNQSAAKLAISYSVLKYVESAGDTNAQAARAARVRNVAERALALTDGKDVILAAVEAAVRAEVAKLNLSPADLMLADGLIAVISDEISKRVGEGILSPEQLVQTKVVLGWIINATDFAIPSA